MKITRTITVNYKAGHSYDETWMTDGELYCPHCGESSVWVEQSEGDYYVGAEHLCADCGWAFYMPNLNDGRDEYDIQRKRKLFSEVE